MVRDGAGDGKVGVMVTIGPWLGDGHRKRRQSMPCVHLWLGWGDVCVVWHLWPIQFMDSPDSWGPGIRFLACAGRGARQYVA